ncbi:expressed unknown protein [Seminavis robusta]|uniref:Uncharacterized protein n=1 Tax=Seminavis robusta TaxID=568900 RepID=A0A9N8H8K8_9STRA|nr:expressed unknown protein [Seminavis robusta]|eukprot:Sro220_g090740.1 n/a (811) ;mRNA; r:40093-42525
MNSSNTKSTSTSNSNALSRRRAGLVAAHEARGSSRRSTASAPAIRPTVSQELSMRALNLLDRYNRGGQHQPTRSESCSDLCYSRTTPVLKKKTKKDRANIPSLDQKIQTLMNLEGHEALHSSLISSPIPPQRELSNPNLCPSGHSRATVLLEDQVHPTTIPDPHQKEQTFRNRQGQEFLHSSMTSPLQPFREPSNPNLCPSGHSRASSSTVDHPTTVIPDIDQKALTLRQNQSMHSSSPLIKPTREPSNRSILLGTSSSHHNSVATPSAHPSLPSLMSLPTTPNTVTSTTIASYVFDEACSEEDDDILSEEETETTYHHHDITLKYPLLGPTTSATNTVALASVGENVERVDDDVSQLKRYWADLGERIHAMEEESAEKATTTANWDIEGSLAELLKRIEAIESQQAKRDQQELKMVGGRVAEKKPSLGPSPMEKSKSKSRSASSAKTASSSRTKKSSRSSHTTTGTTTTKPRRSKSADAGPRKSSRSKKRSESVSRPSSSSKSTSQKPTGSRKSRSSHKDPTTMQDGSASSSRMVDESGGSQKPTSSRKSRASHKDPATMQDGSASSSRMVDESGGSQKPTSSKKNRASHKDPATMQDGSASSSRMVDESGGSHSSRRSNGLLQDGSGRRRVKRRDSLERHIIMSIPGKRLSSRRLKAARSKLVHVAGTKSENDASVVAASRGGKQVKGRSPRGDDALLKAASSPGSTSFASPSSKPSPSSSRASSSVSSKSRRPMSSSSSRQRRISRYSNRSLSRLDARPAPVLGDLDTMDVSWWRYHHEQQSVASSSAGSMPVMNKLRSRAGNKLEF